MQEAARCYDRHAGFHRAIRSYIEGVFTIVGEAISRFQDLKTERGLVDYDDLEHLALHALDHPSVVERLDEELELLLVDEFQDTNPMQLALFMKLARFAREIIFVGDVKQAIFSFRGADPDLEGAVVGDIVEVGPRIAVHSEDMGQIGTALHAVIAAELVSPDRDDAVDFAASLIRNAAGDGAVAPEDAIGCARRFTAILNERFAPSRMLVEHPVELVEDNGQVLHGWIDLLLETEKGWVIIDHKSSPRPRVEWTQDALEHSGQLMAYARALRGAGLECVGSWIHFPVGGGLIEVILDPDVR